MKIYSGRVALGPFDAMQFFLSSAVRKGLKGIRTEDASRQENVENVRIF